MNEHCNAAEKLVDYVFNYESDTFDARGQKLKRREAKQIAAKLIDRIENHLDGVTLNVMLDELRQESGE